MASIATAIAERERTLYQDVWTGVSAYGAHAPGEHYLPLFLEMSQATMRGSVLDAGCGSGKGALALQAAGFEVTCCDITAAGLVPEAQALPFHQAVLWEPLKRQLGFRDWVYSCDVLEHIPTAFTMLVAARLLEVARRGVFFSICFLPDAFGAWVGQPLHQTVQPYLWWREQLAAVGDVVEARDLLANGVFLVRPRQC